MPRKIGIVESLFRYPVKSMRGERLDAIDLGWHGLDGDRRLAVRRIGDRKGFPWLTATSLPELIVYAPLRHDPSDPVPSHVRTPGGRELEILGGELAAEISERHGSPVEMMHLNRGIFDEASVSLITSTTIGQVGRLSGRETDVRRFRPNILISSATTVPFEEDAWVNGVLTFGEGDHGAAVTVTNRDERCSMVNFDPDSAAPDAAIFKTIVRERGNYVGVYAATTRRGRIAAGQSIYFTVMSPARA